MIKKKYSRTVRRVLEYQRGSHKTSITSGGTNQRKSIFNNMQKFIVNPDIIILLISPLDNKLTHAVCRSVD